MISYRNPLNEKHPIYFIIIIIIIIYLFIYLHLKVDHLFPLILRIY